MAVVLAGVFGTLTALAVVIVLVLSGQANLTNTMSLLNDKSVLMVRTVRGALHSQLEPATRMIDRFASLYSQGRLSIDDRDALDAYLIGALVGSSAVDALIVYDRNLGKRGLYLGEGENIGEIAERIETDKVILSYMKTVKPDDPARWGPLVYVKDDLFANVSAPLTRNGKIEGFVVAAIGTGRLSRIVHRLADKNNVTVFLATTDHRLIAHSGTGALKAVRERSALRPNIRLAELDDPVLANYADRRVLPRGFAEAAKEGVEVAEVDLDDKNYVVMTGRMPGFGSTPWLVGAYVPTREVGDEFMRMMVSIAAGIAVLIIAVLLAIWLGRRISRSLKALSIQTANLADLDFEHVHTLPSSAIREIDNSARAFNALLAGLRAFTVYVPRSLVNKLIRAGFETAGRSHEQELTVLFTDIEGFTALSEKLPAAKTAELLNHHFEILVQCIDGEGGTVDKFMGDGLLAFWGAPDQMADHASAAMRAAAAIADAVRADNARAEAEGRPPIRLRVGLHTGPVIVGNIGAYDRVNYTIVGDTVNVCQRLQTLGKERHNGDPVCVLVSGPTRDLVEGDFDFAPIGTQRVRGRSAQIDVWRLVQDGSAKARPQTAKPASERTPVPQHPAE